MFLPGKISLSIPWISLYSSPVTAILEDVYILVGPIADRKYDAAKEEALQNAVKRQMLDILEYPQNQSKGYWHFYEYLFRWNCVHILCRLARVHLYTVLFPFYFSVMHNRLISASNVDDMSFSGKS